MIVSQVDGLPFATHIPFLLRQTEGQYGTLVGHVARANPHWRQFAGQTAMVVFTGPHVYVSPTWYEAQNVLPTWNYTAVHAYGRVEIIDGGEPLLDILKSTVQVYEKGMPEPWTFEGEGTFAERGNDLHGRTEQSLRRRCADYGQQLTGSGQLLNNSRAPRVECDFHAKRPCLNG
jgi:transcriptional regulator